MLFPYSLEGAARIWLEKEPPRSILTCDDLVSKFINKFSLPPRQQIFEMKSGDFNKDLMRHFIRVINILLNQAKLTQDPAPETQVPPPTSSLPKVVENEPEVIKDMVPPTNNRSTKDVQPPVVQVQPHVPNSEPVVAPVSAPMPN
ncbi:hypothetical protein Tco_0628083 [Tanacetum coccineum]|uniref:Reverse transcriptase domain-containing protein n=1 Tax=Tanacetum coccineum TaxID=301880 RepID=A0ABQ4WQ31_9ASTR